MFIDKKNLFFLEKIHPRQSRFLIPLRNLLWRIEFFSSFPRNSSSLQKFASLPFSKIPSLSEVRISRISRNSSLRVVSGAREIHFCQNQCTSLSFARNLVSQILSCLYARVKFFFFFFVIERFVFFCETKFPGPPREEFIEARSSRDPRATRAHSRQREETAERDYLRAPPAPLDYLSHIEQTQFPANLSLSQMRKMSFRSYSSHTLPLSLALILILSLSLFLPHSSLSLHHYSRYYPPPTLSPIFFHSLLPFLAL